MKNFTYYTPTKIFFGKGEELKIGKIIKEYGFKKVLIHYGKNSIKKSGLYDVIIKKLDECGISHVELGGVSANPKLSLVLEGIKLVKKENVDFILAVGGGSVLDSSKSIALGSKVDFSPWLFQIKEKTPQDRIPFGTILTMAASGSDMSNSCVITNDTTNEKRGFVTDLNRPLFSILNPELTFTVSKYQTACGITDIIMHTLERFISEGNDTPLTDRISIGLMKSVIEAGKIVMLNPNDYEARATLLWANSLSHNSLTSCGREYVMSVHQLEHSLSGFYPDVAHGAGLAVLWPVWAMEAFKFAPERFLKLSYELFDIERTKNQENDIIKGIISFKHYFESIGMPTRLRDFGVKEESLPDMANDCMFNGTRVLKDVLTVDYDVALKIYKNAF